MFPFFRDDTNAIITVISKTENKNTTQVSFNTDTLTVEALSTQPTTIYTKIDIKNIFNDTSISNKRNIFVLHGPDYHLNKKIIEKYAQYFSKTKDLIKISSTGVSQSSLLNLGLLEKNENFADNLPLFWQIQARINKKPNYKNKIEKNELNYQLKEADLPQKMRQNIKANSVYMSGIIDRFPLLFFSEFKTFHVSKYFHLESKKLSNEEICLSMNNIFSFFNMELELKEGTRKTLRVGEMGLTKETKKEDLANVMIVDFTKFSKNTRKEILGLSKKYSQKIIYNIEEALQDEDYLKIQKAIQKELCITDSDFNLIKNKLLEMYFFRMRNITKLSKIKEKNNAA